MTAPTDRTSSALAFGAGSVFALSAALADVAELVKPLPDVFDLKLIQPFGAQMRNDMQPGKQFIFLMCFWRHIGPGDIS